MKTLTMAVLVAALAVAGCTNANRFGGGAGGAGAGGIGMGALGDPSDPRSVAYFNQTVGDRVFFAVDQSTLSDDARRTLTNHAIWLMENRDFNAIIEGHADEQGTREYNIALSARRASAVIQFLISQGIAADRLRPIPYGKERPIAICSTEDCYAQNRRAVTVLTPAAGG
ncbi:MAG: peptidoglycan-associated lipoprotein Pal [Rhodobacteraceae bacterium]|jgi:peptidoglycan-associated lipoprotein|nr:peptidoglycan-associated lipoprotein Pal [Paracoccaceae bacterium]